MARNAAFILFAAPSHWQLRATHGASSKPIDIPISSGASVEQTADEVAAALKSAGYRGEPVVLALPSAWCLCASVATAGLPRKDRRRAMLYRLEEKLPLAAEDVVADFLPGGPSSEQSLGVCAQKQMVAPLVGALERNGLSLAAICPAALLAVQQMLTGGVQRGTQTDKPTAILWAMGPDAADALELFLLADGNVRG